MSNETRRLSRLQVLLPALLILVAAGCGTTRSLRGAQQSFSEAATADMRLRAAAQDEVPVLLGVREGGYRMTVQTIDGFSTMERAQLNSDQLWGNALFLKAMSQWRLEDYDGARETANDAVTNFSAQLGPRDLAVLSVLDGLIALDQAYAKLGPREPGPVGGYPQCDFATVNTLVTSGLDTIESKRRNLSTSEPVQRYLLQAKLAGHRTRMNAEDCEKGGRPLTPDELEAKRKDYCAFETVEADSDVRRSWQGRLGLREDVCSRQLG